MGRLARAVRWHRRGLAAVCAACCVLLGLTVLAPPPSSTVPVVVAARDLPAGSTLQAADLRIAQYPPSLAPASAVPDLDGSVGRVVAAAVAAGTPLTASTTVSTTLTPRPGELLVGFHVADASLLQLLQVGDRVTVVSAGQDAQVVTLASRVRVAALPRGGAGGGSLMGGDTPGDGLVVVAAEAETAKRVAAWSGQPLSVALG